ncbi:MAG: hypothetical protein RLZZ414_817 [Bacteroidota bacterium]|jgi:hypothetical protein
MKEMNHPYKDYENNKLWELIEKGIDDLIENQDIELTTRKEYVIGYLCQIVISSIQDERQLPKEK